MRRPLAMTGPDRALLALPEDPVLFFDHMMKTIIPKYVGMAVSNDTFERITAEVLAMLLQANSAYELGDITWGCEINSAAKDDVSSLVIEPFPMVQRRVQPPFMKGPQPLKVKVEPQDAGGWIATYEHRRLHRDSPIEAMAAMAKMVETEDKFR